MSEPADLPAPLGLLAELTHRCPLACPYCSNPLDLARRESELPPEDWERVMREAGEIGVVQVGLSGGEPLVYLGLERIVSAARAAGLYTNLITSGVGLDQGRAARLRDAGLDAVQLSFQAGDSEHADRVAGARAHAAKLRAAAAVREAGLALGLNAVLHRDTIDGVGKIIALAESLGAMRVELANIQLVGWAFANRKALMPTRAQTARAAEVARSAAERLRGRLHVIYVPPDFHGTRPKPCLHGWGMRGLTVNPAGRAMPCQAADCIPGLAFDSVREHSLRWIWERSEAFGRFRGSAWMREPCKSCEFRFEDFGGCRCQAALLAGDAANADPVCEFSPHRAAVDALVEEAERKADPPGWIYRSADLRAAKQ